MTELLDLAARCEASPGPDWQLDLDIAVATGIWRSLPSFREWHPTASLDAAVQLIPDGYEFGVGTEGGQGSAFLNLGSDFGHDYYASTPALALCVAALHAASATGQAAVGETEA